MPLSDKICFCCVSIVTYQVIKTAYEVMIVLFGRCLHYQPDLREQGRWAVITGATEGIGRAFAEVLANKGINLILIGYSKHRLIEATKHIREHHNVQALYFEADFTKIRGIYSQIEEFIKDYEIGILVNHIGMGYPYPESFLDVPYSDSDYRRCFNIYVFNRIIHSNLFAITHMSRLVLPGMVKRNRGVIINISSTTADIPSPMLAVFAACKAFINKFSADLREEYGEHGVIIQCLTPGYVSSKVTPGLGWVRPTPEKYVDSALKTLGIRKKSCGYLPHSIMLNFLRAIYYFSPFYSRIIMRKIMEKVRERALRLRFGGNSADCIY